MATPRILLVDDDASLLRTLSLNLRARGHEVVTAERGEEAVDVARHQPAAEVKGASFCELKVERQTDGQWLAQCVVDV